MTSNLSRSIRRAALRALLFVPALMVFHACTNLTEVPKDALTPENAFRSDAEVLAGVASVYAVLRSTMWEVYNLSEVTTDEIIVPTRGQDWYDNGRWLEIHKQSWTANSGSALEDMNGAWNNLFSGIAKANLMIDVITKAGGADAPTTLAELRTLRAWYYYLLMDMFGGVPLVTVNGTAAPRESREAVFKFIESELKASSAVLPPSWPGQSGRVTSGVANAILASLYLNAEVYTGTVSASGLQKGTARWADAIAAADKVLNSGQYTLATDWRKNFSPDNHDSPENIFVINHTAAQAGLGMSLPMRTLHYNQLSPGPWNGFATLAETYRAFDPADNRRDIFLAGPQVSFNTKLPVTDRGGIPLNYTVDIIKETAAGEAEGARLNKFSPLPGALDGNSHPNNFPFFRLAEMYLIKAEAQNELGSPATAIATVNIIRQRQFTTTGQQQQQSLPTNVTQDSARKLIFNERLFELTLEGKRRQDMIRAGTYTSARHFKGVTEGYKILFPIPATQIQTNSKLVQNAGY